MMAFVDVVKRFPKDISSLRSALYSLEWPFQNLGSKPVVEVMNKVHQVIKTSTLHRIIGQKAMEDIMLLRGKGWVVWTPCERQKIEFITRLEARTALCKRTCKANLPADRLERSMHVCGQFALILARRESANDAKGELAQMRRQDNTKNNWKISH